MRGFLFTFPVLCQQPSSGAVVNPFVVYPELTFTLSCLTVREDMIREENVEVKAKGGNTHA